MLRSFLLIAAAGALCCSCSRADRPVAVRAQVHRGNRNPRTGNGAIAQQTVSVADKRFKQFRGKEAGEFFEQFGDKEDAVATAYMAFAGNDPVAKIGGYIDIVQEEPRPPGLEKDWVVLLQIRSAGGADGVDIMWGDAGREDLRRRDFSKVAYYWDNH